MAFFNRQPKRSVPVPVKPPQHGAPNPLFHSNDELSAFRWRVVGLTLIILGLGLLGYAVYGPWFAVRTVSVVGTREVNPISVKEVAKQQLQVWRWGILPNRNLWLLSRPYLASFIENKIRQRISIEEVRIVKQNRHDLQLVVVERTPVAVWKTGEAQGTIDRTGVIINLLADSTGLPLMVDVGNKPVTVGEQVVTEPVMQGFIQLHNALADVALPVENFLIPIPTCPTEITYPTNTNTDTETNVNTTENSNSNDSNQSNLTNGGNTNSDGNANTNQPQVVVTDCDVAALAKASQEIHVKLKDGPLVLFDRHQDLPLAVQTVKRLIAEPANSGVTYMDVRFQERVYIR